MPRAESMAHRLASTWTPAFAGVTAVCQSSFEMRTRAWNPTPLRQVRVELGGCRMCRNPAHRGQDARAKAFCECIDERRSQIGQCRTEKSVTAASAHCCRQPACADPSTTMSAACFLRSNQATNKSRSGAPFVTPEMMVRSIAKAEMRRTTIKPSRTSRSKGARRLPEAITPNSSSPRKIFHPAAASSVAKSGMAAITSNAATANDSHRPKPRQRTCSSIMDE